jgi:hypothetical protein
MAFLEIITENNTKMILEYSSKMLESSSPQKWAKTSEYRVLDARQWYHYFNCIITFYRKTYYEISYEEYMTEESTSSYVQVE